MSNISFLTGINLVGMYLAIKNYFYSIKYSTKKKIKNYIGSFLRIKEWIKFFSFILIFKINQTEINLQNFILFLKKKNNLK